MKKVFLGLGVALVAVSTSAFINTENSNQHSYAIIAYNSVTQQYIYTSNTPDCPDGTAQPCSITTVGSYSPSHPTLISKADVENTSKIIITHWRAAF